jgi:hypothetical protein
VTRPADDEVTSDVDPEWIAGIRAQVSDDRDRHPSDAVADRADRADDGADRADDGAGASDDWLDGEPPWDPEATVGASDGLIDRIRSELHTSVTTPIPAALPAPRPAPQTSSEAASLPDTVTAAPPPIAPIMHSTSEADTPHGSTDAPVAASAAAVHSTTMRWEPRQRLATSAPVQAPPTVPIGPQTPGLDRTKVAIATIIAIALVLTVWLLVRGDDGGSGPAPTESVPGSAAPTNSAQNPVNVAASTVPTSQDGG